MIANVIKVKRQKKDPDPLFPNVDPRIQIRIHVKMRWIRNAAFNTDPKYVITSSTIGAM